MSNILRYKPYIKCILNSDEKKVIFNRPLQDGNQGTVYELSDVGVTVIKCLEGGITRDQLFVEVLSRFPDAQMEVESILHLLLEEGFVEKENHTQPDLELEEKYNRILPLWAELEASDTNRYQIQRSLMKKKIGVIGCGTIGFGVISKLLSMGISHFYLVDGDNVERTNLTRQPLFTLKDIGRPKVDCVKEFIEARIEHPIVETHIKTVQSEDDLSILSDVDLIVVAADENNIEIMAERFGEKVNKPISYTGGYIGHTGKIYPFYIPNQTHSHSCLVNRFQNTRINKGTTLNEDKRLISSTSQMADYISSIVSFEIVKFLIGLVDLYLIDKLVIVDFKSYSNHEISLGEGECICQFG
ncbi:ThiF family adenylyltransferase [Guptibacillus hwajinpoensis]|uniref:THIF-type NAD/FAD binding fold domain-containing protein n=1 Tax=Guptibacillus hwajinpoensis TaxID=208199 RepID=A0A0J6CUA3_9BACL|nr:ThiF family adenylyltransferase [Alkalihalobacillus macyae]KMM36773.1 hypothetical protein AB986_12625 [Alkalihalobacillus macyae]